MLIMDEYVPQKGNVWRNKDLGKGERMEIKTMYKKQTLPYTVLAIHFLTHSLTHSMATINKN